MSAIKAASEMLGGPSAAARAAGVTPPAVHQWLSEDRKVPPDRCPAIELACSGRVTVEQLRPDVRWVRVADAEWPHPQGRPCIDVATPAAQGQVA